MDLPGSTEYPIEVHLVQPVRAQWHRWHQGQVTSRATRMATGETGIGWGNDGVKPVVPDMKELGF